MWDDEDYEPAPFDGGKVTDKWDGEDEEVSLPNLIFTVNYASYIENM